MAVQKGLSSHLAWTSDHPIGLQIRSAEGSLLRLEDDSTVIDMISGIAVSSIGHRHPAVVDAIREQIDRHLHVMVYGEFRQDAQDRFATKLTSVLPDSLQVAYFTMTGTEANEGALKLAKKVTGRSKMIAFEHSYHGDTHGSLSVTGRDVYRDPFAPLLPEVEFLPFDDMDSLTRIDEKAALVITEPIQGEGGVRVPSHDWHRALRDRCTEVGALLIFDEIQTGFGRTGSMLAFEAFDVVPDILTLAKAMGGGMPLGAFVSSAEHMDVLRRDPPLSHVTTFGGHPVSCAAASAALDVLLHENLPHRARALEQKIRARLASNPDILEIRGMGAMLGLVLGDEATAERFVAACLKRGVLLGWTLHSASLIRVAPPLNIPFDLLDEALESMEAALKEAVAN